MPLPVLEIIKLCIVAICLPVSLLLLLRLMKNLRRFKAQSFDVRYLTLDEAPTVSVCIPVRNEDHAIRDCLERVLASNYPKMEVIVLDDGSVDNTTDVVKIFARSGVRFIKGEPLPDGWIGKNKANDQLVKQASGQYILFLSADTDIRPDSISRLMAYVLQNKLDMIGVMPLRLDGQRPSAIFSTLRYFWTVVLSRPKHPAYTTASWMVRRQALIDNGGFEKYKAVIIPEAKMATDFDAKQTYGFVISDLELGFSYEKRWSSQLETAVRTLWPVNVRSNFNLLATLLMPCFLWATLIVGVLLGQFNWADVLVILSSLLFNFAYLIFAFLARRKTAGLAFLVWFFAVPQELCCLVVSFIKHQTNSLVWKGRSLTDHID